MTMEYTRDNPIPNLIARLPEIYQPIFGHEREHPVSRRPCADRWRVIGKIVDALRSRLRRPLRVLDLGCAQGYFSFALASRGAVVTGVDHQPDNIRLCRALGREHPDWRLDFRLAEVSKVVNDLKPGEVDLVLGLSVFHHMVHENGVASIQKLLVTLSKKVEVLILELALQTEPLYWGPSQPEDPRLLLEGIPFVKVEGLFRTHLSKLKRPLFFASAKHGYFGGDIFSFDRWTDTSHPREKGAHLKSRRYFFTKESVVKLYRFSGGRAEINRRELLAEKKFLTTRPRGFPGIPRLIASGEGNGEGWIVEERMAGLRMDQMISKKLSYDSRRILQDVLEQLVVLEKNGLYHNDVRVWNVLCTPEGRGRLFDFGSITGIPRDCQPPVALGVSFLLFARDVVRHCLPEGRLHRGPGVSPTDFPSPYNVWVHSLWTKEPHAWTFGFLLRNLSDAFESRGKVRADAFPDGRTEKIWDYLLSEYQDMSLQRWREIEQLNIALQASDTDRSARLRSVMELNSRLTSVEADRGVRLKEIERLGALLKESEVDRAARGEALTRLGASLKEVEADRGARLKEIERLSLALKVADHDRNERMKAILDLQERLKESELDRAARLKEFGRLGENLRESELDRAARLKDVERLSLLLKESESDREARLNEIHRLEAVVREFKTGKSLDD